MPGRVASDSGFVVVVADESIPASSEECVVPYAYRHTKSSPETVDNNSSSPPWDNSASALVLRREETHSSMPA